MQRACCKHVHLLDLPLESELCLEVLPSASSLGGSSPAIPLSLESKLVFLYGGVPWKEEHTDFPNTTTLKINHFTPKSDLIDFTLSKTRQFYSSKGDPFRVKGLIIM